MVFSLEQRIVIVEGYVRSGSIKETQEAFADRYSGTKPPAKRCIQSLVRKWHQTGSVGNMKKSRPPSVLTPEVVRDIQQRIASGPRKSTRRLSQQVGVSRTTCRRVLRSLNLKPYRLTCVHDLKEPDKAKRVNYCKWLLTVITDGHVNPLLYFMTDEAWFHLSGHVNTQCTRYWSAESPHLTHETPLHDQKIGVWCAVSGTRIVGPIFFESAVNTAVYLDIFEQFYHQLTPEEKTCCFFQQDGATCHTSHDALARVHELFTEERTVSNGLWPPRSPDLSTCAFYLWGKLKQKVYASNPHTLDELKENITNTIRSITVEELRAVSANMLRRAQRCIDANGDHFQHLL
uniref:uncharacterized protein LOC109957565 n=1 Tax=Monopterus albus TaxID=43700 RepID=UPI0009B45ACB|nr:uncharacterized protein LOC109957565 [Monopterus albus]